MTTLEGNALRVMTYNVHVDGSRDGDNPWSIRRDLVASVIRFHQADVAGLQEASMGMIGDLDAYRAYQLGRSIPVAAENPAGALGGAGVGIGMGLAYAQGFPGAGAGVPGWPISM